MQSGVGRTARTVTLIAVRIWLSGGMASADVGRVCVRVDPRGHARSAPVVLAAVVARQALDQDFDVAHFSSLQFAM